MHGKDCFAIQPKLQMKATQRGRKEIANKLSSITTAAVTLHTESHERS